MKILLLTHAFIDDSNIHGVGVVIYELAKQLKHDFLVVDRDFSYQYDTIYKEYRGTKQATVFSPAPAHHLLRDHIYEDDEVLKRLDKIIQEIGPFDLVNIHHLNRWPTAIVSYFKNSGLPIVLSVHDPWYICPTINYYNRLHNTTCSKSLREKTPDNCESCIKSLSQYRFQLDASLAWAKKEIMVHRNYRDLFEQVDAVVYPTDKCASFYTEEGYVHSSSHIIPHFIEMNQVQRQHNKEHTFGYIGNIGFGKGIDLLLTAFRKVTGDVRLKIYGSKHDSMISYLLEGMVNEDPRIEYCGPYGIDDLSKTLSDLDTILVPSVFPESFNLCSYAGVMAKILVIVSEVAYHEEFLLEDSNCLVFETGNAMDLTEKMQMAINRRFIETPTVNDFTSNHDSYDNLYQKVLSRNLAKK